MDVLVRASKKIPRGLTMINPAADWRIVVPSFRAFYAVHGGCKLHPNQARGKQGGNFGGQLYYTTPHYMIVIVHGQQEHY